jgi:hypothetical protein
LKCSGRDLNPGSATRKATMLDRILHWLLQLAKLYTTGARMTCFWLPIKSFPDKTAI